LLDFLLELIESCGVAAGFIKFCAVFNEFGVELTLVDLCSNLDVSVIIFN
jgi:hypothetical protein